MNGILARIADVALGVVLGQVLRGVERLDLLAGDGGEERVALRLARVDLLQPLVGAADGFGLDCHEAIVWRATALTKGTRGVTK